MCDEREKKWVPEVILSAVIVADWFMNGVRQVVCFYTSAMIKLMPHSFILLGKSVRQLLEKRGENKWLGHNHLKPPV